MSRTSSEFPGWYVNFQAAVLMQLPRPNEIDQTTGEGWTGNQKGLKKELRSALCLPDVITETLLKSLGTVTIPARTEKFIAKDHFVVDIGKKAKVKISSLGNNFRENFLNKIEEAILETTLRYQELKKSSRDNPIIGELGGNDKSETTLSEMFALMEMQPNGEDGHLLVNGYANIFYIRDSAGVLWAVFCRWSFDGWCVYAFSVDDPFDWRVGRRVLSRNS